jgi:hypothetical protein
MLAEQFHSAAFTARTTASLDETARCLWRAHAEAQIPDAEAEAISEAIEARRAALAGKQATKPPRSTLGLSRPARGPERREKMFGLGRPRALDRNAKVRVMHWGRCLARSTEKGKAYGQITAKALAVLEALLWGFHNARSGLSFHGSRGSSGYARRALTYWAPADGAGGSCGPPMHITFAIPDRAILLSPISSLEHRVKIFHPIKEAWTRF